MSSFSLLPLFRRHQSDNEANHDVPDATEMTQIVDIDRILALTDARHTLRSLNSSNNSDNDDDDDDSSISSIHNMQAADKEYYDPSTNGGRRPYFDDEFDDSRQRLVSDNDIEHGDRDEDDDNQSIVSLERGKVIIIYIESLTVCINLSLFLSLSNSAKAMKSGSVRSFSPSCLWAVSCGV